MKITSKLRKGVPTLIGTVTLRAMGGEELSDSTNGKRFTNKPRLSKRSSKNVIAKFNNLTKDSNQNIIEYKFDIIYTSTGKNVAKKIKVLWNYNVEDIPDASIKEISRIIFKRNNIHKNGEKRKIVIKGDPGATFGLAVNESFIENTIENNEIIGSFVNKGEDISILKSTNALATHTYGQKLGVIKGIIGSTGRFAINQEFPSNIVKKVKTTNAMSGGAAMQMRSTAGLKEGDLLSTTASVSTTPITIDAVNSATQVTLDTGITLAISSGVTFSRNRAYSVDLIPEFTPNVGDNVSVYEPIAALQQYVNPILTITNKTTDFVINSASSGVDYLVKYSGIAKSTPNKTNKYLSRFTVTLVCEGRTFDTVNTPIFDSNNKDRSWWTNSVAVDNGGTELYVSKFSHSSIPTTSLTISYNVDIVKWGTKDVNMTIDLDSASSPVVEW
jgi:hypothetical protein